MSESIRRIQNERISSDQDAKNLENEKQSKIDRLIELIKNDNRGKIYALIYDMKTLDVRGADGETPLIAAIKSKSLSMVVLVTSENKASLDFPDSDGVTPREHAIEINSLPIILYLNNIR